jgi:ABC-2 type transport system permease protein
VTGFLAFLRKELIEIRRTWRLWVLPGILLFVAITSPILAEITPELVRSLAKDQPGVVIEIPDPVALDAYRQFISQVSQLVLLALIIASAGIVSGESRAGTAILVLTKPVSRTAFVVAKVIAQATLLIVATASAAVICWGVTLAIFGTAPVAELVESTALWLLLALLFVCLMTLLSVLVSAQAGAAGAGIALYFVLSILSQWGPAQHASPAGLFTATTSVIDGDSVPILIPVLTTLLLGALCLIAALWRFNREELAGRASAT